MVCRGGILFEANPNKTLEFRFAEGVLLVFGDTDTWDSPRLRFFDCRFTALKPRFHLDVNAMSSWSDLPPQAEAKCRSFLDVKSLTRFEMSAWSQHTSSLNRKLACIL